jgi:hypothetical protein
MFNPAAIKKKKATEAVKMDDSMVKHALNSMEPEMEDEEEDDKKEEMPKHKGMGPEAKLEIEIMLRSAKKKKGE